MDFLNFYYYSFWFSDYVIRGGHGGNSGQEKEEVFNPDRSDFVLAEEQFYLRSDSQNFADEPSECRAASSEGARIQIDEIDVWRTSAQADVKKMECCVALGKTLQSEEKDLHCQIKLNKQTLCFHAWTSRP